MVEDSVAFVEIDAIDNDGIIGNDKLLEQCKFFLANFFPLRNFNDTSSAALRKKWVHGLFYSISHSVSLCQ